VSSGLDGIRLTQSVFHGDTLYALTEVLETQESHRDDAGEVVFRPLWHQPRMTSSCSRETGGCSSRNGAPGSTV